MVTESGEVDELGRQYEGAQLVDKLDYDFAFNCVYFDARVIVKEKDNDLNGNTDSDNDGAATSSNTSVEIGNSSFKLLLKTLQPTNELMDYTELYKGGKEEKEKADQEKAARAEAEKKAKEQGDRAE